jgi:hypothetical protein
MNRRAADDRPGPREGPAVQLQVTVLRVAAGPTARERLAGLCARSRGWPIAFVVVLAAAVAVFVATASPAGRSTRARAPAAAYAYPLRCVSEAIALHDPRFARAAFERTIPSCPPHGGEWLDHDARPQ